MVQPICTEENRLFLFIKIFLHFVRLIIFITVLFIREDYLFYYVSLTYLAQFFSFLVRRLPPLTLKWYFDRWEAQQNSPLIFQLASKPFPLLRQCPGHELKFSRSSVPSDA